jgi:hypothetical protein
MIDRVRQLLSPGRASLTLVAAVSAVAAVAFILVTWSFTWAADINRNLAAAEALLRGRFGTVEGYLYTPFAALLTVPLLALPAGGAILVWLVAKVAIVAAGVAAATRGLRTRDRVLIAVTGLSFLPIVHDLLLGNVTVLLAAVIALVVWNGDRAATGVPFGIVLAAVPKPVLVPVLVWMLIWRRRAAMTALLVAAIASIVTLFVAGPDATLAWIAALRTPPILSGGNFALTSWPAIPAIAASAVTVLAAVIALRRGEAPGLVGALVCGLLVSNYTVLYGAGVLLAAAPSLARAAPRATAALALIAPIGLIAAFPVWLGALLGVALTVPRQAWPTASLGPAADPARRPAGWNADGEATATS